MLPVAITCPVWWVARLTARMLASLAVAVACSVGAAALPVGAAASAQAAAATGPLVDAGPARTAGGPAVGVGRPSVADDASLIGRSGADGGVVARACPGSSGTDAPETKDRQLPPVRFSSPAAAQRAVVVPVDRRVSPTGLAPVALGSRAPPLR